MLHMCCTAFPEFTRGNSDYLPRDEQANFFIPPPKKCIHTEGWSCTSALIGSTVCKGLLTERFTPR